MKLKLERIYKGETYTIGKLYIDDKYFCDTLEDTTRELNNKDDKIYGKTAIPTGLYDVILSFSPTFQRVLPLLLNVPYFKYIRIHSGNDEEDSEGCILVGFNKIKGKVIDSKDALNMLMELLQDAEDNNEKIQIEIV